MPEYLAPGVFVEETSFRAKSIEGVSTTTTGFVGPSASGPVTLAPDIITNLAEFEMTYGDGAPLKYSDGSESTNFLWQAVRAFFSEGGKRLYFSRIFKPLVAPGITEYLPISPSSEMTPPALVGTLYPDGHARALAAGPLAGTNDDVMVRARHPGAQGNRRVRLTLKAGRNLLSGTGTNPVLGTLNNLDLVWIRDDGTGVPPAPGTVLTGTPNIGLPVASSWLTILTLPSTLQTGYTRWKIVAKTTAADTYKIYESPATLLLTSADTISAYLMAWDVANKTWVAGSVVTSPYPPPAVPPSPPTVTPPALAPLQGKLYQAYWNQVNQIWEFGDGSPDLLPITALVPSVEPGQGDTVRVVTLAISLLSLDGGSEIQTWSGLPLDPNHQSAGLLDSLFARFATEPATTSDARNLPLVFAHGPSVDSALAAIAALFPTDPNPLLNKNPLFLATPTTEEALAGLTIAEKFSRGVSRDLVLTGGNDGQVPGTPEYEGKSDPSRSYSTGLKQLEEIEDISIVAAPGSTWNYPARRSDVNAITGLMISHAERMRYRVAVLDCPPDQTISDVRDFRAKLDSKYAALHYPWVTVSDPVTRQPLDLPPSGFVAGIYARNDIERGVWKAPANEIVRLALGFETNVSKPQQEVLNPEGINCFRYFEGRGNRLWGARTISSDPEWKYVNVRRYFAYLEHSIDKGTQWAVFEPNGELLWANVRRTIQDFLLNEWQSGALLGDKPEKAFFVRCDRSTMTQNDLDNGRLVALVGVAPVKPAEFVIFRIGQWTADSRS